LHILKTAKSLLRPFVPNTLLEARARKLRAREHRHNADLSTREIFESIYAEGKWGGRGLDTGSGSGSEDLVTRKYNCYVNSFLSSHAEILRIVDIGCGDMRVARNFELRDDQTYIGTDIVTPLIALNQERYGNDQRSFLQLDAIVDPLPAADLYLMRQVLQHLSNQAVHRVIEKVCAGRYALITEHHPALDRLVAPNLDKPTGSDVRVYDGSGLYLDLPPFNLPRVRIVLETAVPNGLVGEGERLTTYLVQGTKC
jgi:hypothetical protein